MKNNQKKKKAARTEKKYDKSLEVEGKTVQEAIKQALKTLHAEENEVTIKVLKEEHKGLFGMEGAEKAKIKVSLKKKTPPHS